MFSSPQHPEINHPTEINHRTMKLIVGLMALSLASLTSLLAHTCITSISESYYDTGNWSRNILVGFLFAISAFMFAYNGYSPVQKVLSKIAAIAALGIALFRCKCETCDGIVPPGHSEIIPHVHGISAAVMFGILAIFCYIFFRRAVIKPYPQAKSRAVIYALCGLIIVASISILALDGLLLHHTINKLTNCRLTFYGERAGLVAFGVSWLTASHCLPFITTKAERFSPFGLRSSGAQR